MNWERKVRAQPAYPDRKPYSNIAAYIPLGMGYKYNLNPKMNIGIEAVYNFTTTDYLDDVSKTYAGINNFPTLPDGSPSVAALLQDRSYETGKPAHRYPGPPAWLSKPE